MKLLPPFIITSGLCPGLEIDGAYIECREGGQFAIYFSDDGHTHLVEHFRPGPCHTLQMVFADILSFLSVWVEAINSDDGEPDGRDYFPESDTKLVEWAKKNDDEFAILRCIVEEEKLITDG